MYCPKCGELISDEMPFCPKCHYQYLQEKQKTVVNEAKHAVKRTIANFFTSKCFLAINIILIIIGSFYILLGIFSLFLSLGISQLATGALGAVFALISGISGLYVYKKKKVLDKEQIKKINYFNHYNYILGIVSVVLMPIILLVFLMLLLIFKFAIINDGTVDFSIVLFYVMIIMIILLGGLGIAYVANYFIAWQKMKQYYDTLANTIETGEYKPVNKYPFARLFVISGIIIFLAIMQVVGTFIALSIFDLAKEFILTFLKEEINTSNGDYTLALTYINLLFGMIKFVLLVGLIEVVINLLIASYMIISALAFKNIHQEAVKAQEKLDQEKQKYQDVVNKTSEELRNYLATQSLNNNEV